MADSERYVIEILDLALNAVETMASSENQSCSLSTLAPQLNMNRSRLFRILKTLQRRGYVEFDAKTATYRLGLKVLTLGQHLTTNLNLRREAEELLKELAAKSGDCVHLIGLAGDQAVVIERYLGDNILQGAARVGQPLPLHTGAAPKLLLAFLPEKERLQLLNRISLTPITPRTITSKEKLCETLERIRKAGYAEDDQDFEIGVYAIGAPVYDHAGAVIAGVSITTPVSRFNSQRRLELVDLVVATAQKISRRLGYI